MNARNSDKSSGGNAVAAPTAWTDLYDTLNRFCTITPTSIQRFNDIASKNLPNGTPVMLTIQDGELVVTAGSTGFSSGVGGGVT